MLLRRHKVVNQQTEPQTTVKEQPEESKAEVQVEDKKPVRKPRK